MVTSCERCPRLCASRRTIVNGFGPLDAPLWEVGQGPGREEEVQGRPLCGWSGDRIDYLEELAGIDPAAVYKINITRCRPPRKKGGDSEPTAAEIANCREYLLAELVEGRPRVVVTLGALATQWFLPGTKISEAHGRRFEVTYAELGEPVLSVTSDGRRLGGGGVGEDNIQLLKVLDDEGNTLGVSNGNGGDRTSLIDPNENLLVVPMYHPAAAHPSRNPGLAQVMMEDWERLGHMLRDGVATDEREYRRVTEAGLSTYLEDIVNLRRPDWKPNEGE